MSILNQLSSQVGDRTEASNRRVAAQCLLDPALLDEIARGLKSEDGALVADCAEVMTKVAEEHPEIVKRLTAFAEEAREDLGDKLTKRKGKNVRPAGQLESAETGKAPKGAK